MDIRCEALEEATRDLLMSAARGILGDLSQEVFMDNSIVENYWSQVDCSASDKNFYYYPPLRSRACKLIFDEYDASRRDWTVYWTVEKYLKDRVPFERALSICCGFGEIERSMSRLNVARKIEGMDIAPGAIEQAVKRAEAESLSNIEYNVADINRLELAPAQYDLIWANGALHHVENLEHVIPMLHRSLRPGGMLISNEYIGPKYQQVGERQAEIINAVKHLLPAELRQKPPLVPDDSSLKGKLKFRIKRRLKDRFFQDYLSLDEKNSFGKIWAGMPVEWFLEYDPSESIRGNEIIPILKETFEQVEVRPFHGSILFYALDS
ncbi:MAG: class I SAM-dependent methyltransferase [Pyrinomonadaceae bacterium]